MFCPKCGKEISDQAKFCPKCGAAISNKTGGAPDSPTPVNPASQAPAAQEKSATATAVKPAKQRKSKVLLVAVPIVAAVIVAALFLLPKSSAPPEDTPPAQSEADTPETDPSETNAPAPVRDANAELLAIIDRAEAAHEKANSELPPLNEDKDGDGNIDDIGLYIENCRQYVQILSGFLEDFAELRKEADAVNGLDDKMKRARDEYFDLLRDVRTASIETRTFIADYLAFFDEIVAYRPSEADYESRSEYSKDLSAWVQEARDSYEAISYPSCVESEWKQYKTVLEYNESIAEKLAIAVNYNDWLRFYSTRNMTDRYDIVELKQYDKLLDCINSENSHASRQWGVASALVKEMHAYVELGQEERDAYEFTNICTGEISPEYEVVQTIYPSLYNTYDAFAIIKTGCISGTRSIVVEAEIEGFSQKYRESFDLDSSYKAIYIKPPALTSELNLSAAKPAQLKITLTEKDGTLIEVKTFDVTLKSETDFNWYSDEYGTSTKDNILCFLTPEATAITKLKRQAATQIQKITGGAVESFLGYQKFSSNWDEYVNTYLQAAGLMSALNEMGVRYVMDTFTMSEEDQQHITLPEDVLANKSGLCIETSLVVASALQSAGMHAFLVFPPGHAMVAVENWNSGNWAGTYLLIETTAIENSANTEMFNASARMLINGKIPSSWEHDEYQLREPVEYLNSDQWKDRLENYFEYVIDCNDSRLLGLTPFAH